MAVVIPTKVSNFLFCGVGCLTCFYFQKYFNFSNVFASALVGLIGSFLPVSKLYDQTKSITCIYTGSFAAMCTLSFFSSQFYIILLSLIVGFYFNLLNPYFKGFGGKLGSIAFASSCSFILIMRLL